MPPKMLARVQWATVWPLYVYGVAAGQTQGNENDNDLSRDTACCMSLDEEAHGGEISAVCTDDSDGMQCSELDVGTFDALELIAFR